MGTNALIRRAVNADRDQILAFTRDTFSWGDYIEDAWSDWLTDPNGCLLVAEADGLAVAVAHAVQLSPTEGWLEGIRVHPNFRRRGLADALNLALCSWLQSRGVAVARLAIESANAAPLRQVDALGWSRVADFCYFARSVTSSEPHGVVPAAHAAAHSPVVTATGLDLPRLSALWSASPLASAAAGLVAVGWHWRRMTDADLASAAAGGRVLLAGPPDGPDLPGLLIWNQDDDGLRITWLEGSEALWQPLLQACLSIAAKRGGNQVSAMLPDTASIRTAMTGLGFVVDYEMAVFAREMDTV